MHRDYERADEWSHAAIGAAIEVHRDKGPGLLEDVYERCYRHELLLQEIPYDTHLQVPVTYKDLIFDSPLRLDIYVDKCLIVELKAVEKVLPVHKAQLMSYMKLLDAPVGLLINFHALRIKDDIHRMILPGANQ
jgi:GxxExxY protein